MHAEADQRLLKENPLAKIQINSKINSEKEVKLF